MTSQSVMQRIVELAIVPAVRVSSAEAARRAVDALASGGITTMEIPLTCPDALDVIRLARRDYGDNLVIGAGTVLDAATARAAIVAGAQFVVSPALSLSVIACCKRYSTPVFPGALTPTEILTAWEAGADLVKVFPASALGGAGYIKALRAPLPQVRVMPMGGVTLETAAAYLEAGAAVLGVGADLISMKELDAGRDQCIIDKADAYCKTVAAARMAS